VPPHTGQVEGTALGREIRLFLRVEKKLWRTVAARQPFLGVPGLDVGPVFRSIEFVAGVEEQHVDAVLRQVPCSHSARCAAADDDDGMDLGRADDLHAAYYARFARLAERSCRRFPSS